MKFRTIGIFLGNLLIFLMSNLFLIIWNNLLAYYLLTVLTGLISGILLVTMETALITYLAGFSLAFPISVGLVILPSYLVGAVGEVDILVAIVTTTLSRNIVVSFPACVIAGLIGCFMGSSLKSDDHQ